MDNLPALPPKGQASFEATKAKAELDHANSRNRAFEGFQELALIAHVFFAYCVEARNACRTGDWTVSQARSSSDSALKAIFSYYYSRWRGGEQPRQAEAKITLMIQDEQRWKDHLSELIELSRGSDAIPKPLPDSTQALPASASGLSNGEMSARRSRKRGPKPDYETASRVAATVARVVPDGDWHPLVDEICEALDKAEVPVPRGWPKKGCQFWTDRAEPSIAVKAIQYRLDKAKSARILISNALS